jgi:hypothetical protein
MSAKPAPRFESVKPVIFGVLTTAISSTLVLMGSAATPKSRPP